MGECISRMSVHQHALGRMSNSPKNTKIRERQRRRVQSVTHCVHQNRHSHHFKQKVFSFRHQMHSVFFWWSLDQIINKSSFAEHTHSIQRAAQIIRVSSVHACFVCVHMCVCVCLCLCGIAQGNIFKRACGCQENVLLDRATVAPSAHRFFFCCVCCAARRLFFSLCHQHLFNVAFYPFRLIELIVVREILETDTTNLYPNFQHTTEHRARECTQFCSASASDNNGDTFFTKKVNGQCVDRHPPEWELFWQN